jgi:alpha 1,3-glucosidase
MVVIVDPHLKRSPEYPVYKQASDLQLLIKPKSGEGEYEGWCWCGSSSWADFFNPATWDWWKTMFKTEEIDGQWTWTKSTNDVHIWNDMNEVSEVGSFCCLSGLIFRFSPLFSTVPK